MLNIASGGMAVALGLTLVAGACTESSSGWLLAPPEWEERGGNLGPPVRIVGKVEWVENAWFRPEGGVYVIRTADGELYTPTNLPRSLRQRGLPVEATARFLREVLYAESPPGPSVEIVRIRRR